MDALTGGDLFRFEGFRLDRQARALCRRNSAGAFVPIAVGSRAFEVLDVLIGRAGDLVSRDEFMAAVWPATAVEDSNLNAQIAALRRVLDDGRAEGSCIQTVPGRGYRFAVPVRRVEAESRWHSALPHGDPATRPRLSVVVLPFTSLSNDPEQQYFVDGITEDLTTDLSRISGNFVIVRNAAFTYKDKAIDAKQIGRELGVRYVLEGSVRRSGSQIRINIQLANAETGAHLWAERFDCESGDLLRVQDEITRRIASGLGTELIETERLSPPPEADLPLATIPEAARDRAGRRQITALASELIVPSGQSDRNLEDLREAADAFHHCISETAARHNGHVFSSLGNTLLVLFGYPAAHENDAEQAVRAGLELCTSVQTLKSRSDFPMECRVGIETGMAIVGDRVGESRDRTIVGDAPMLAARLQALAHPDMVAIGPMTRRLIGDLFDYRDLGAIEAGGLAGPVPAWQVLRASAIESRFEALRGSPLTRLVGREEEINLLLRRWSRAIAGDGQVVLVSGEPGIGKSRLCAELDERLRTEPHLHVRYFCSPYHQDSALFPFIDQLGRMAAFARYDTAAARLEKLKALLGRAVPEEDVGFLADLLSLPASGFRPLPNLTPQRKKERTLQALIRKLEGLTREQPVIMVFEDAQWSDPTSQELLDLTIERVLSLPVLLIVTFRPEFEPPWTGQPRVTLLALNRLDRRDRIAVVEQIAGDNRLADEIIDQIVERTDGVPLFVEELTRSVLESGDSAPGIPATLRDSLMARLDRLGSVRDVAQVGAAIGREFSYPLLRVVSRLPESKLQASLSRLVASELVFQRGVPPEAIYSFKHALVQDAAHDSLLRSTRQQLHAQIADALETNFPELMDSEPEIFAQHYAEAGLVEKSVAYWGKAGHRSAARSAMAEAATQFERGLDQLALLPDSHERQRRELEFRNALGVASSAVKGLSALETGKAYARARELWEQLGSPAEFLRVPFGQSRYHVFRGELDIAQGLDENLLRLSRQRNDSCGLILGHLSSGRNLRFAGRFALSRSHLEEVLTLYDPNAHRSLLDQAGIHPQNNSRSLLGIVLFCLGFPDQALARSNEAIAEARRLDYPRSLASSLANGVNVLSLVGDDAALGERADELVAVATEQAFPYWRAQGTIYCGWAKVKKGDVTEGISLLRIGSMAYRATGAEAELRQIALLAGACAIAGRFDEAVTLLDDALQIVDRGGERWFEAELHRQKGQLLLRQGHTEAGEELYFKAFGIAREQDAKMWELRAAVSLARLRRDQDYRAEARDLLAPVYGWFTEGFDTPDLKEAKAVSDTLW